MKMEVLSVQNQYPMQFGVIQSDKEKDWMHPLILPPLTHNNLTNDICSISSKTSNSVVLDQDNDLLNDLSSRLQKELRAAKSRHLSCTEVLLPANLLNRVAAEIIRASEKEPCGIRGCSIYIDFKNESSNTRRIAALKVEPNTVSTFELFLILKHDKSRWTSILPQFLKNLARSNTIMISPDFTLIKNKLYHTSSE